MSFSNYSENAVLGHVFCGVAMTMPVAHFVSLHSADPGETGANELATTNGYARQAVTFAVPAGDGVVANSTVPEFTNTSGSVSWSEAPYFCVWDAVTGGNCIGIGPIPVPKTVAPYDTARFAAGDLVVTLV